MTEPKSVCVIGAGVIGLSTSIALARRGHIVRLIAADETARITSSVAAAFWYPFWTGAEPDHSWYDPSWAEDTYRELEGYVGLDAGVTVTYVREFFDSKMTDEELASVIDGMWWKERVPATQFALLSAEDVAGIALRGRTFRAGAVIRTFVVHMGQYLPYLQQEFLSLGGRMETQVVSYDDLPLLCEDYDAVINCTGLGSRELVPDPAMFPVEGIVITVDPIEGLEDVILMHTGKKFDSQPFYIVPRGTTDIILGGTIVDNKKGAPRHFPFSEVSRQDFSTRTRIRRIIDWCYEFEPRLRACNVRDVGIGYRPKRKVRVRLEPGTEIEGVKLFHNYGHAGGGVTLSWGCAAVVAAWVETL